MLPELNLFQSLQVLLVLMCPDFFIGVKKLSGYQVSAGQLFTHFSILGTQIFGVPEESPPLAHEFYPATKPLQMGTRLLNQLEAQSLHEPSGNSPDKRGQSPHHATFG